MPFISHSSQPALLEAMAGASRDLLPVLPLHSDGKWAGDEEEVSRVEGKRANERKRRMEREEEEKKKGGGLKRAAAAAAKR